MITTFSVPSVSVQAPPNHFDTAVSSRACVPPYGTVQCMVVTGFSTNAWVSESPGH